MAIMSHKIVRPDVLDSLPTVFSTCCGIVRKNRKHELWSLISVIAYARFNNSTGLSYGADSLSYRRLDPLEKS